MNQKVKITISEGEYIKNIFKSFINKQDKEIENFSLKTVTSKLSEKSLQNYIRKLNFISNNHSKLNQYLRNFNIYNSLLFLFLFILESNNYQIISLKTLLLSNYVKLVKKIYISGLINDDEINNLILFIIYLSFIDRKVYSLQKKIDLEKLSHNIIKFYDRFKIAIELVLDINKPIITKTFINNLKEKILISKSNFFLLNSNIDLLKLIELNIQNDDEYRKARIKELNGGEYSNDEITSLLIKLYSFHYNINFLSSFIETLKKNVYDINKDLTYFNILERYVGLLEKISKNEDYLFERDPYILNKGFVFNNNIENGIIIKNVIIQSNFSLIFSFSFQPENKELLKKKYPLIFLNSESYRKGESFLFFIEDSKLKYLNFDKITHEICVIEKDLTYIVCYSFIQNSSFEIIVKSNNIYDIKIPFKMNYKKSSIIQIGKSQNNESNFEGFIGPILLFNSDFNVEFFKNLLNLKGSYEKLLYLNYSDTTAIDKYDRNLNYILDSVNYSDYLLSANYFKKNNDYYKNLLCYIAPPYDISNLNKKTFVNYIFKETKLNYLIEPIYENGATFFFKNNFTIFEFVKYEGINYLILNLELLLSNLDKKLNDNEKIDLIIFYCSLIDFSLRILIYLDMSYFTKEIKSMMFTVEKSIQKVNFNY